MSLDKNNEHKHQHEHEHEHRQQTCSKGNESIWYALFDLCAMFFFCLFVLAAADVFYVCEFCVAIQTHGSNKERERICTKGTTSIQYKIYEKTFRA